MRLGIDFGTCYSSAALLLDGMPRPIKEPLKQGYSFPSSIYLTEREEILVGQAAENKRQKNPQRYRREFKRDLGSPDPYTLGDSFMLPEELVIEVLKKLKQEAEKVAVERGESSLAEVMITVPATYQSYKRNLMSEACSQSGFRQIELLEEPVAAAIYYSGHAKVESGDIILVYDLGGGTFDATLIQKQDSGYQLLGIPKGLSNCGGIEFDRQIYQELKSSCSKELRQQLNAKDAWLARAIVSDLCRDLKHQLSEEQEATIYIPMGLGQVESFSLTRQAFNQIIASLVEETIDCCDQLVRNTGIDWSQVNQVLLVGGSCRIPYVKEVVARKLGRSPLLVDEPELAVCLGAAVYKVSPEQDAKFYLLRGLKKVQVGNYTEAIEEFNRAINIKHNYAEAYYNRGLAHSKLDELQQTLKDYTRAIDLNRNYAEAYLNRGNIRYRLGDLEGAIQDYDLSLESNPDLTEANKNRDIVLRKEAEEKAKAEAARNLREQEEERKRCEREKKEAEEQKRAVETTKKDKIFKKVKAIVVDQL